MNLNPYNGLSNMFKIWKEGLNLKIRTDEILVENLLKTTRQENSYLPWTGGYGFTTKTYKIYENRKKKNKDGTQEFTLGLGWIGYVLGVFKEYMTTDDYENISHCLLSDSVRTIPFPELRDIQNSDVLHLLNYKIGLFCVYTGYGKTQVISSLVNYAYSLGDSVLLVTPGKKAMDELVKRCKKNYSLDIPSADGKIDCIITSGLLNRSVIKDPEKFSKFKEYLSKFKWVLADEVEYTINSSGELLYSNLVNVDHLYGFSGTADKKKGEMISFANGLSDTIINNKGLVKWFGPSVVYRMPIGLTLNCINLFTSILDNITFKDEDFNSVASLTTRILANKELSELIVKVGQKYPLLYIPLNNLEKVIYEWINNYFIGKFRILLICFEGYIYFDLDGTKTKLKDLDEAWNYVNNGLVDIIPSTSSGYRALDLPGLKNILLINGISAGVVLQSIGRVARSKEFNLISLVPIKKKLPAYTKGLKEREELINKYYKYCTITHEDLYEYQL